MICLRIALVFLLFAPLSFLVHRLRLSGIKQRVDYLNASDAFRDIGTAKILSEAAPTVVFIVPLNGEDIEDVAYAKQLAASFDRHIRDTGSGPDSTELYFIPTQENHKKKLTQAGISKRHLVFPSLNELEREDAECYTDFRIAHCPRRTPYSRCGTCGRMPSIKQLFGIQEICGKRNISLGPDRKESNKERKTEISSPSFRNSKYVVFHDAEARFFRAPRESVDSLFEKIYNRRELWVGTHACHRYTTEAGRWMAATDYHRWKTASMSRYLWWNQLPFFRCDDWNDFSADTGWRFGTNNTAFFWEFLQGIYQSWLWKRRKWSVRAVTGCKFCTLEKLSSRDQCRASSDRARADVLTKSLKEIGALWVAADLLRAERHAVLRSDAFMAFHYDRMRRRKR